MKLSMSAQPNVTLPDPILAAVQEEAKRQHKSLNEMVGELVTIGLNKRKGTLLEDLMEEGRQQAIEKYGRVPSEEEIVSKIHEGRQNRLSNGR